MSRTIRTALGQEFELERHLPSIGWHPKYRGGDPIGGSGLDFLGDDSGIFVFIGLLLFAVFLIVVIIPVLLFVLELALLMALIVPGTIFALVVGLKQHLVVLRRSDGTVAGQRTVRGIVGSLRAGRELMSAAHSGAYR